MRCKATTHRIWCNSLSNLIISAGFLSSVRCRFCNKAVNIARVTMDDVPSPSPPLSSSLSMTSLLVSSSFVCASLCKSKVEASLASSALSSFFLSKDSLLFSAIAAVGLFDHFQGDRFHSHSLLYFLVLKASCQRVARKRVILYKLFPLP